MSEKRPPILTPLSVVLLVVRGVLACVAVAFGFLGCVMLIPNPMRPGPVYWPLIIGLIAGVLLGLVSWSSWDT